MTTGSPTPNHDELMGQLWDYLQGELSSEQAESFEAALRNSPETIQAGVDLIEVMVMTREAFKREGEARKELFLGTSPERRLDDVISAVADPHAHAAKTTLTELGRLEAQAQAEVVDLSSKKADIHRLVCNTQRESLTTNQLLGVGEYVLRHSMKSKAAALTGLAAALLLALFLFGPWRGEATDRIAHGPGDTVPPIDTPAAPLQTVATLTAIHNAQWGWPASAGPALGDSLHTGDRLILTTGFAEITTHRGAVALLEAPCTIELTNSDNAIRLHSGKLVGKCETDLSKGFTVHAPGMDVVDLGTEFGVDTDTFGQTDVYVFSGRVALTDSLSEQQITDRIELATGQSRRIDRTGHVTPLIGTDLANRFVRTIDPSALYERMILADKPVVYYRMDNIVAGVERNLASDRYHAKVFGDVAAVTESGRSSFSLTAPGDHLLANESIAELRGAESYTIECWVRATRYGHGSICEIIPMNWDNTGQGGVAARLETLGEAGLAQFTGKAIRFAHKEESNLEPAGKQSLGTNAVSKSYYPLERWFHLAAVKSGADMTLYLNGESVGQAVEPEKLGDTDLSVRIGKFFGTEDSLPGHLRQFIGQLDELAIYDYALSVDAVRARVSAGQDWSSP